MILSLLKLLMSKTQTASTRPVPVGLTGPAGTMTQERVLTIDANGVGGFRWDDIQDVEVRAVPGGSSDRAIFLRRWGQTESTAVLAYLPLRKDANPDYLHLSVSADGFQRALATLTAQLDLVPYTHHRGFLLPKAENVPLGAPIFNIPPPPRGGKGTAKPWRGAAIVLDKRLP